MSPLLAFVALLQTSGQASVQTDTPVHTVQSFVASLNRGDIKDACDLVVGGKFTYPASTLQRIIREVAKKRDHFTFFDLSSVGEATVGSDNNSTVPVSVAMAGQKPVDETMPLKQVEGRWLLTLPTGPIDMQKIGPLTAFTMAAAQPVAMLAIVTPIVFRAAGKQPEEGRELGAGASFVLSYSAMHHDTLPKDFAEVEKGLAAFPDELGGAALRPLVESVHKNATDHHWVINQQLASKSLFDLTDPFHTVLVYEEKGDTLDYRFDGKALVVFANGVTHLVSPDEAMKLRWIP